MGDTEVLDRSQMADALHAALEMGRGLTDGAGLFGFGVAELRDGDGKLKLLLPFANLITDAGDTYYAAKAVVGIAPAAPSAPTAMTGMKLGTGVTAVAKAGAGGALVTYKTASNVAFDASFPTSGSLGAGLGATANYKTTWVAGVATDAALAEVVIVNDSAANATSTAANTISRSLFSSTINKAAGDVLAVTWAHKFLGA